jgi:hypothetical protein
MAAFTGERYLPHPSPSSSIGDSSFLGHPHRDADIDDHHASKPKDLTPAQIHALNFDRVAAILHNKIHPQEDAYIPPIASNENQPLSETSQAVLDIVKTTIIKLETGIPHGLSYTGCIFYCTEERVTNKIGQQSGELVAILDKNGMSMVKALVINANEEPDLDTAVSVKMTDKMIHQYTVPLLEVMARRFETVKIPHAKKTGHPEDIPNIEKDLATTKISIQTIEDLVSASK